MIGAVVVSKVDIPARQVAGRAVGRHSRTLAHPATPSRETARRVAQFQDHYLHHTIEEPFRRRGLRDNEALEAAMREVSVRAGRSGEDLLGWLFRRHSEVFEMAHMFGHVETALEEA